MEYSFYDIVSKFNDQPNKIAIETDYSNITYEELLIELIVIVRR